MRNIPPKPTMYKGALMRSKTEANAAQWFEGFGWNWIYEPETFVSDIQYTPDFYIPEIDTFIEVKPLDFLEECNRYLHLIEPLKKTFAIICPAGNNIFHVFDMYGKLDPCDPGDPDGWGWHHFLKGEREIHVDDRDGRMDRVRIYMGGGCGFRESCACTN